MQKVKFFPIAYQTAPVKNDWRGKRFLYFYFIFFIDTFNPDRFSFVSVFFFAPAFFLSGFCTLTVIFLCVLRNAFVIAGSFFPLNFTSSSLAHSFTAFFSSFLTFAPIVMLFNVLHFRNAFVPIAVTLYVLPLKATVLTVTFFAFFFHFISLTDLAARSVTR